MKKQIGNDARLEWTILRKGVAEDFTDATDLLLTAFIPNLSVDEVIIPIARVGNVFTLNIPTTDLAIGTYTIRLQYKKPDPAFASGKASISTAVNGAFQIVPIGASEDDLNDELTSNVVYCTDGATFIPSVSVVGNEIILSWTNDKGYANPLPINIKGDKGDVGKSAYEYYLESTTEPTPLTEAEFSTMLGNLPTYVQDVIFATSNANNAATNANNAANTAIQAAEDADTATLLANAAADNANTKALFAQTQGDYAKAQGDNAKLKGDYAHEQGLAAYTAANQANATNDSVQAAENLRVSAESSRVTAESNRVSQENDRIDAENVRVSNEDDRISAESARVTAESGRVTAENGRVTAENDRVQNDIYRGKYLRAAEYDKRVTTDSGTIRDRNLLNAMYDDALNLLPNTDLWYNLECGIKTRVSGLNTYVTKVYDLSTNNRDATQATESSQPYLVSNINPANRLAIWGLNRLLPLSSSVAKITTDKWTLAVSVKALGGLCEFIGSTNTRLSVTTVATDSITFKNESGTSVSLNLLSKIVGTSARLYFVAKGDGTMQVWLNGVLQGTLSNPTNATFANLYSSGNGELKAIRLFNKDLNKSEIEFLDAKMAAYYPPFEGVVIGNQVWEASNAMDIVAPDGTAIPEVQPNDTASAIELLTNGNFESGLVGTLINETGGATATYVLNTINPISGTQDGRLQVTSVGINSTRPAIILSTVLLSAGKVYKVGFSYKINSGTAVLSAIYNGSGAIAVNETFAGTGSYDFYIAVKANTAPIIYFNGANLFDLQIDNISVKEAGWADSQAIYDYYISIGQSVLEASRAASMWCKYSNSDDNAVIYGFIANWWAAYLLSINPPKGLRYPTEFDSDQLRTTLGGSAIAGGKLKKEGLTYWNSPNTGASNESGFTAIGGGVRLSSGGFSNLKDEQYHWVMPESSSTLGKYIVIRANSASLGSTATVDKRYGMSIRFLKNAPTGLETQELDTGIFTTDIATAQKELTMSFGHKVTEIKVNSLTNNLTNFKVELRSSAGVLLTTLVQNVIITANSPIDIPILVTQPMLFQDAKLWITATGNTGATNLGMQVKILTRQNMY